MLVIDGLAPFDFAPPMGRFDLWPFLGWFEIGLPAAIQLIDWAELFGKLFLYGALLWVIKEWGASIGFAVIALAATVLAIEVLQIWLPDQTRRSPIRCWRSRSAWRFVRCISACGRARSRATTIFQRARNR